VKKKTAATGAASVLGLALIAQAQKRERRRKEEEKLKRQMYSSFFRTIEFGAPMPGFNPPPDGVQPMGPPRPPKKPPWKPPTRIPPLPDIPPPNTDDVQPIPDEEPGEVPKPQDIIPDVDPGPIPEVFEDFFPEGGPKWRYDSPWRVKMREMLYRLRPDNYKEIWEEFKKTDEYDDYRREKLGLSGPYGERGPEGPPGA
jgi:hypothetical protein